MAHFKFIRLLVVSFSVFGFKSASAGEEPGTADSISSLSMKAHEARNNEKYEEVIEITSRIIQLCKSWTPDKARIVDPANKEFWISQEQERVNSFLFTTYLTRGQALEMTGRHTEAISSYTDGLKHAEERKFPYRERASLLNSRAIAKRAFGDINGALIDYTTAYELHSDENMYVRNRAGLWVNLGDFTRAIKDYDRALEIDQRNGENCGDTLAMRGRAKRLMGDLTGALDDLNKACALQPEDSWDLEQRGNVYLAQGNFKAAIADYSRAIEIQQNRKSAFAGRALAYFGLKNYRASVDDFRRARSENKAVQAQTDAIQLPELFTNFNMLEYAYIDPETQSISLFGRMNPEYDTGPIPYFDLLQTAWNLQGRIDDIAFSLENSPEFYDTLDKLCENINPEWVESMKQKKAKEFEYHASGIFVLLSPPAEQYGWFAPDAAFIDLALTPEAFEYAEMLNIRPEIEYIVNAQGTEAVHDKAMQKLGMPHGAYKQFREFLDADRKPRAPETYLETARALQAGRGLLGMKNEWARLERAVRESDNKVFDEIRNEFIDVFFKTLKEGIEARVQKGRFHIGPILSSQIFGAKFTSHLQYTSVPENTQLARILFEADYSLKFITGDPLSVSIPDHVTHVEYLLQAGELVPGRVGIRSSRCWISPDNIEIHHSPAGNIIAFQNVKMRINVATEDKAENEVVTPADKSYAGYLSQNYEIYTQVFPELHELREAVKILSLVKALRAQGIRQLPYQIPSLLWKAPAESRGTFSFYEYEGGDSWPIASGGINLRNIDSRTTKQKNSSLPELSHLDIIRSPEGLAHTTIDGRREEVTIAPHTVEPDTLRQPHPLSNSTLNKNHAENLLAEIQRLKERQEKLERHTAELRAKIKDIQSGIELSSEDIDSMLVQQDEAEQRLFLDSISLLSGAVVSSKKFRDLGNKLWEAKWIRKPENVRMWKLAGKKVLDETEGNIQRLLDSAGSIVDVAEGVDRALEAGKILEVASDTIEGRKSYAEAREEVSKFIADQFTDALWKDRTNPRGGGPQKAVRAGEWALTYGRAATAFQFVLDAESYIRSAYEVGQAHLEGRELLDHRDNQSRIGDILSQQNIRYTQELNKIKKARGQKEETLQKFKKK